MFIEKIRKVCWGDLKKAWKGKKEPKKRREEMDANEEMNVTLRLPPKIYFSGGRRRRIMSTMCLQKKTPDIYGPADRILPEARRSDLAKSL